MMRLVPEAGPLAARFWLAAAEGRLVVQRCGACGATQHPPLPICSTCRRGDLGWSDLPSTGTLYAFTVVHHATHVAFEARVPYAVGLVELTPGIRVVGALDAAPDSLAIGMPLRAVFEPCTDAVGLLRFVATVPPSRS